MTFDLILRDGEILDGTGAPALAGSVGVTGGRIAAIGDLADAEAARVIDCSGRTIAPGFIDMHSHSDWVLPQAKHGEVLAPLVEQGVTTLVGGNCGSSPAPCCGQNERLLPLLGKLLHDDELDYEWSAMGEFLGALETRGLALNLAQLAGHGAIRSAVKGLDAAPSTPDEVARMADLARACLDQGAIGISTGLGYAPGDLREPRRARRGDGTAGRARRCVHLPRAQLRGTHPPAAMPARSRATCWRSTRPPPSTGPTAFPCSTPT